MKNMIYRENFWHNKIYKEKHKEGKAQCTCCLICLNFAANVEQAYAMCIYAIPQRISLPLLYKSRALNNFNKFPKWLVRSSEETAPFVAKCKDGRQLHGACWLPKPYILQQKRRKELGFMVLINNGMIPIVA
jgi:hypothetical protein